VLFGIPFVLLNNTNEHGFKPATINTPAPDSSDIYVSPKIISFDTPIVIYNSHMLEKYNFGEDVTNTSQKFCESLQNKGFKASVINNEYPGPVYGDSYKRSRKLIEDNALDYDKKILLDVHKAAENKTEKDVFLVIGGKSKNFMENINLAQAIIDELNHNSSVTAGISKT
jgi:hypothetical protein